MTPCGSAFAVYRFTLADSTLLPDDSSGTIDIAGHEFKATVVGQQSSMVDVQIEGAALDIFIPRAILLIDDLGLLRRLAEFLEAVPIAPHPNSSLALLIFHPKKATPCKAILPATVALDRVTGEQRIALEQACGSETTYIWGPPGTGKTFVIAHLIAALTERGERVLMTSHTHAAVNQSIYEAVKPGDTKRAGPLANSDLERDGKIVRIGSVTNPKVPDSVRLDSIVERKAVQIQAEISVLHSEAAPLSATRASLTAQSTEWERLSELTKRGEEAGLRLNEAVTRTKQQLAEKLQALERVEECRRQVLLADQAWFFRARRVDQAGAVLAAAERTYASASILHEEASVSVQRAKRAQESVQEETKEQADRCATLRAAEDLKKELASVNEALSPIEKRLETLAASLDGIEQEVINSARVVAVTLTKCYVGRATSGFPGLCPGKGNFW